MSAEVAVRIVSADALNETADIMKQSHDCLKRWAARYAKSENAKKHVAQTRIIMEQIELWLIRTS